MRRLRFTAIHAEDVTGTSLDSTVVSEERVRQTVFAILESNVLCSIATVTPDHRAHINTAYFSYSDDLELYFLSHPSSLHCRNLSSNSSIAMTVFSSAQEWTGPGQGLQLFGTCAQAEGSRAEEAERFYGRRFQGYGSWKATLKEDDPARQYQFYQCGVRALKFLDEKNLGDAVLVRALVTRD